MKYEIVIGLEVHVELATKSKLFCSCSTKFGSEQNENVCPACAGMPGMLPIANKKAIELGIAAGIVTNSEITSLITFDKKNYFYPDLPTGYQLTQLLTPICKNGYVDIEINNNIKRINLKQIHIEEDAGKLIHSHNTALVDYNRTSIPLVEVVSEPDFRSAAEVVAYLEKLRSLFTFAGISDCRMQEGSMRCDVNISVRKFGETKLGVRTEIKNMNSLKAIVNAIEYEAQRHINALEDKTEELTQETRRYDDNSGQTFSMRNKEGLADYRYFPSPDTLPIKINSEWIEAVRMSLPEMAHEKFARISALGIATADAKIITNSKNIADIFDALITRDVPLKDAASWIVTELLSMDTEENKSSDNIEIDTNKFADLILLVNKKVVNRNVAKKVLALIYKENIDPIEYIEQNNLSMISNLEVLDKITTEILIENAKIVEEYKQGNERIGAFLIGKIMAKTAGKADPKIVKEILQNKLNGIEQ